MHLGHLAPGKQGKEQEVWYIPDDVTWASGFSHAWRQSVQLDAAECSSWNSNTLATWCKETPILWPPDAKKWLIGKDPDAGKDWRQEEKGTTEDEMVGWYHWLNGQGFRWTPGVGDGQGGLACCSPWGCKESDTTERLNWTELNAVDWVVPTPNRDQTEPRWVHPNLRITRKKKLMLFFFLPQSMWELSSLTWDQTSAPCCVTVKS